MIRGVMKIYFDDFFHRENFGQKYQKNGLKIIDEHKDENLIMFECPENILNEIKQKEVVGNIRIFQ